MYYRFLVIHRISVCFSLCEFPSIVQVFRQREAVEEWQEQGGITIYEREINEDL